MSTPIIKASDLSRHFERSSNRGGPFPFLGKRRPAERERVHAVADVSFSIQPGEMVGYIGQNGAGKSTTIKMLAGILVPSSGDVTVLGMTPSRERKRLARHLGVVFGQRTQLWWDLPLHDSLELLRHMYRVPEDRFRKNLAIARDVLDLDPFMDTPVRQLSLGQRMRGDLAGAILHDPPLLILDEPTIGLDLVAKDRIRDFLRRYNAERGATMLLTTHDLGDIEHLCDRVIVIDQGQVQFDGSTTALQAAFASTFEVRAEFAAHTPLPDHPPSVHIERESDLRWRVQFTTDAWTTGSAVRWLTTCGDLRDIAVSETSLEEVIRTMYRGATVSRSTGFVH